MATTAPIMRPLSSWRLITRHRKHHGSRCRHLTQYHRNIPASQIQLPLVKKEPSAPHVNRPIITFPPPKKLPTHSKTPLLDLHSAQISLLDPSSARTSLFSKTNREGAKVGDILLVRTKTGEPFAGFCMNIRRRGVETGILLRNELTRVAVEMWFKIYSPNVEGIEVVQRKQKRARRARLTYLRKKKHDMRSVAGVVAAYERGRRERMEGGREMVAGAGAGQKKGQKGKKQVKKGRN